VDGVNDYLTKASATDGLTSDLTIAGWIFPTGWGESNLGRIFDNGKVVLTVKSDSTLSFTRDGATTKYSGKNLSLNTWHHYVVTSTGAGVTNFTIDGSASGTANQDCGTPASGTTYYFGSNNGTNTFLGVIEKPRIYKRIFSSEDIALDYGIYND
jgi:hypothetical protein